MRYIIKREDNISIYLYNKNLEDVEKIAEIGPGASKVSSLYFGYQDGIFNIKGVELKITDKSVKIWNEGEYVGEFSEGLIKGDYFKVAITGKTLTIWVDTYLGEERRIK